MNAFATDLVKAAMEQLPPIVRVEMGLKALADSEAMAVLSGPIWVPDRQQRIHQWYDIYGDMFNPNPGMQTEPWYETAHQIQHILASDTKRDEKITQLTQFVADNAHDIIKAAQPHFGTDTLSQLYKSAQHLNKPKG